MQTAAGPTGYCTNQEVIVELQPQTPQSDRANAISAVAGARQVLRNIHSPTDFLSRQDATALMDFLSEPDSR